MPLYYDTLKCIAMTRLSNVLEITDVQVKYYSDIPFTTGYIGLIYLLQ